ncbi:MAG: LytTR family DNA-binding domain-containing protein [Pseudomonadota bacterium]
MNGGLVQFTLRELKWVGSLPRLWLVFALVLAIFALTGPFGTYEVLHFPARLGYWFIVQAVTWSIALTTIAFCGAVNGKRAYDHFPVVLTGSVMASVPIALAVEVIGIFMFGRNLTLTSYIWQLALSVPISALIGSLVYFFLQPGGDDVPSGEAPVQIRLLKRLPPEKRGPVQYLSMQDHYVEVVTDKGRELVLLRLADAIEELAGVEGFQVHRSHWVALDGIDSSRREGGKLILRMRDGAEIPVSRSYHKEVKVVLDHNADSGS